MTRQPFPHPGSLFLVPGRESCEASSSWLQRIAMFHARNWAGMHAFLKLRKADPDFAWPWDLPSSSRLLATSAEEVTNAFSWCSSYVAQARPGGVVMGDGLRLRFGLCKKCIEETRVLHYRSEFRFSFVTLCPRHAVALVLPPDGALLEHLQGQSWDEILSQSRCRTEPLGPRALKVRLALECRICRILKCGFERHPNFGVIPAQAVIAQYRRALVGSEPGIDNISSREGHHA